MLGNVIMSPVSKVAGQVVIQRGIPSQVTFAMMMAATSGSMRAIQFVQN